MSLKIPVGNLELKITRETETYTALCY